LRLVFDPDFSAGSWPGPLRGGDAAAGEEWVDPERLAQVLETALGLPTPTMSAGERAALLVPAVIATQGFWSASASVDAFGSARRLLEWSDQLAMAGWQREAHEPRLQALADLTRQAPPGLPDRLTVITTVLQRRNPHIDELRLLSPADQFEPLWRRVLTALAGHGTRIEVAPPATAPANGDLANARSAGFSPRGDDSLALLRPSGALQAAEEVAAWLAQLGDEVLGQVVVIGADPVLDAALQRHGLPTLGTSCTRPDGAMLQLLPLVLEMGWQPQDPQRAFELLSLRPSPVPAEVAGPLRAALREWPAVDSDAWREALVSGLSTIADANRRARVESRQNILWRAEVPRGATYTVAVAIARTEMLRAWLAGLAQVSDTPGNARTALAHCGLFLSLVRGSGLAEFSEPLLHRFLAEATRTVATDAPFTAQAGLAYVGLPGSLAGEARHVIWWSFDKRALAPVARLPLTRAERDELVAQGVELPAPARLAAAQAERWQRPLFQATHSLLLVCPERDEAGDELHPHPFWDEVLARIGESGADHKVAVARLVRDSFARQLPRARRERLDVPAAQRRWTVAAGRIARRDKESPSSIETLLGCSFKWTLDYPGRLRETDSPFVSGASDSQLLGSLLHRLLAQLFASDPPVPAAAEVQAGALFDRESPRLAAVLWLPGAEKMRAEARRAMVQTAGTLATLLHATGARVLASEQPRASRAFDTEFEGTPDLLLGSPLRIVDLKWGGASFRRTSLTGGTALQLAAYSFLSQEGGAFPPVAYLIMSARRLLTTTPEQFPGAESASGPSPEDTWRLLERAHATLWAAVQAGNIEACGVSADDADVPKESKVVNGQLVMEPPCRFCSFASLCGRSFARSDE
jgi:ATP-dependent helicase/nuclease subunit B